jgi:dTDP-4-dehydrorhamnose 3,5-epimerase
MALQARDTTISGARLFFPDVYPDDRGFFKETYSTAKYQALGLDDAFVQDSVSFSAKNVIRGLHGDPEMSKLVTVLRGAIWDVIVDVRQGSPTYLKWEGFDLSADNHVQLYIPKGCAHGFIALTDDVVFSYKHGALHNTAREFAYRWNDPTFAITWPLTGEPRISAKDQAANLYTPTSSRAGSRDRLNRGRGYGPS